MNKRIDLIGSLAFVALGIFMLVVALNYPPTKVTFDAIGPKGFPIVIGSLFIIGGAFQSVRSILFIRRFGVIGPSEGTDDEEEYPSSALRGFLFIVGAFVYLALLPFIGFLILTPIAVFGALWSLQYRPWWKGLLIAVIFTIVGFLVFGVVLSVPLPQGFLAPVLFALGIIDFY